MTSRYLYCLAVALGLTSGPAAAQSVKAGIVDASAQTRNSFARPNEGPPRFEPPPPPDPASIKLPKITYVRPDTKTPADAPHVLYHKPGVSFANAIADFQECFGYANLPAKMPTLPTNLRLTVARPKRNLPDPIYQNYGLVGAIMGALITPSELAGSRNQRANMRLCMGFKNYRRYRIDPHSYLSINGANPRKSILMQAKVASGPVPAVEAIAP